jgi:hypothetical protein
LRQLSKKILLLLGVLLLFALYAGAKQPIPLDSSRVAIRKAGALTQYQSDKDFDYNQQQAKKENELDSWWRRFMRWIGTMQAHPFWGVVFDVLVWGICLFAIIYVVLKIVGMEKVGLFAKNSMLSILQKQFRMPFGKKTTALHFVYIICKRCGCWPMAN